MNAQSISMYSYLISSICILLLTVWGIYNRLNKGALLTGVTGLYFSALIFMGVGPLAYLPVDIFWERLDRGTVIRCFGSVAPFLAGGIFIAVIYDKYISNVQSKVLDIPSFKSIGVLKITSLFFTLALVGYLFLQTSVALSGAGTFFPVFRIFLYPSLVLAVYLISTQKPLTFIYCTAILLVAFYLTATSEWRSQLIFFFGSIGIGLLLRSVKYLWPMIIAFLLMIMVLLPFQQFKKMNYNKTKGDFVGTFITTLEIPFEQRIIFASYFFAERINYGREIAYVQNAMERKWLDYSGGTTYEQVLLQLIPRAIWPTKPSFNQYTNHYIPRRIGLVGEEVEYTSWGVNAYAEFIMNFHYRYLLIFVPLLFGVINIIDRIISRLFKNSVIYWITSTSFFFITFEMVGVVNVSTYILWLIIITKGVEFIFRMRLRRSAVYQAAS
jgi:hypothetical protein